MDVKGMWERAGRRLPRPMLVAAGVCGLVAVCLIWSIRQSRLTREALDRAAAAEETAARVRSDLERSQGWLESTGRPPRDRAVRRTRHDDPREIERVNQLYAEIQGLTHARERIDSRPGSEWSVVTSKVTPGPIRPR